MRRTCNKIQRYLVTTGILIISALTLHSPLLHAADAVGYIQEYNGFSGAYTLLRGREKHKLALFMPLQDGDWICIRDPENQLVDEAQNHVIIQLGNQRITINPENAPYLVTMPDEPPSSLDNFLSWASGLFGPFKEDRDALIKREQVVALVSRGEAEQLSIPLLEHNTPNLLSGKPHLVLAWLGGTPPFHLEVHRDSDTLLTETKTEARQVQLPGARFVPGTYRIRIRDAKSQRVEGRIQVVAPSALPLMPADIQAAIASSGLSDVVQHTLYLAWLSEADDRAWALEAYQRIADYSGDYQPANVLKAALEHGW